MVGYEQAILGQSAPMDVPVLKINKLVPLLKWAGGKEQELKYIRPLVPPFDNYYEPFVGGGAVFFSLQSQRNFLNDKSSELVNFYLMVIENNTDFFHTLSVLSHSWLYISNFVKIQAPNIIKSYQKFSLGVYSVEEMKNAIFHLLSSQVKELQKTFSTLFFNDAEKYIQEIQRNLLNKARRMKALEMKRGNLVEKDILANIESALKSAFYMHLRYLYNKTSEYQFPPGLAAAIFFFVRENAYASMFRYNSQGEFNVPYGGISYNRKDLAQKISYMQSPQVRLRLSNTVIENMDFEAFLQKYPPQPNDFIFFDPPYHSEFSTYTQNEFGLIDHERLAHYLSDQCQAKFMLVIKSTEAILNLYSDKGFKIRAFNKKYLVSFQDRNDRDAEHLIITNY